VSKFDIVKRLASSASTALADASPSMKQKALDYLSAATGGKVGSVADATAYASGNKGTLALLTRALVSSGVSPDSIFTKDILGGMQDADMIRLRESMKTEFSKLYSPIDAASSIQAGDQSARGRDRVVAGAMERVRNFFGGSTMTDARLKELHVCLRIFSAASEDEISSLLADKQSFSIRGAM
jgi:hypothetical protein